MKSFLANLIFAAVTTTGVMCFVPSPSSFTGHKLLLTSRSHVGMKETALTTPFTSLSMVATDISNGQKSKRTREERLQLASKGLQVHVVGLSIHHADVTVREKLAIAEKDWNTASTAIVADGDIVIEAAVLSTCNRFEIYYAAADPRAAMVHVTQYLAERSGLPVRTLRQNLFMLSGNDAVWHVMRVAGGLDSLIVGEGQILSQVRQCYLHSIDLEDNGKGGKVLSRLLNNALAAGKRVRAETGISKGSVSISSAAVELSEMVSQQDLQLPFSECHLTAVGAGKMTRLLITHLASRGLKKFTIVNRSLPRAQELKDQFPDVEIEIKLMDDLWDVIGRSDIVYTATSCEDYVIDEEKLELNGLASGGKPIMLVDISVPRNVNDNVKKIKNVVAYNVDDLKAVVAKNTAMRQREMLEAEALLQEEAAAFVGWRESLSAIPTINQLQERANNYREEELRKCAKKLSGANLSEREFEAVERLSRGIVNKLLHGPMAHLRKQETSIEEKQATLKELSAMFRLEDSDGSDASSDGTSGASASTSIGRRSVSSARFARR